MTGLLLSVIARRQRTGYVAPTVTPVVTWDPLDHNAGIVLSGGNLIGTHFGTGLGQWRAARASFTRDASIANHYFELVFTGVDCMVGVMDETDVLADGLYVGRQLDGWGYYSRDGNKINGAVTSAYGSAWTNGDIIGIYLKTGRIYFYKNGVIQGSGDPDAGTGFAFDGINILVRPGASLFTDGESFNGRFSPSDITYLPSGANTWGL